MVRALDHQGLLKLHQDGKVHLREANASPVGFPGERPSGSLIPSRVSGSRSSLWAPACRTAHALLPAGAGSSSAVLPAG